jgi:type I restriction enzyme S subunit
MNKEKQKLVPELRFPEFENDGDWLSISVDQLVKKNILFPHKDGNHGNIHPKSSDFVSKGIPFIMANDIRNGEINYSKCKHISKKQADSLQKGFAEKEDVLITHKGTVGEVAIIGENEFPYLMLTPQVTYYRVKDKSKLSNEFLRWFFCCDDFQRTLLNISGGGTRAYIGITEQAKLNISIPPTLKEQEKIANNLNYLFALLTSEIEKLALLKDHKKGLLQQLFPVEGETIPQFRFPEFENDGDWLETTLDEVAYYENGKAHEQ